MSFHYVLIFFATVSLGFRQEWQRFISTADSLVRLVLAIYRFTSMFAQFRVNLTLLSQLTVQSLLFLRVITEVTVVVDGEVLWLIIRLFTTTTLHVIIQLGLTAYHLI